MVIITDAYYEQNSPLIFVKTTDALIILVGPELSATLSSKKHLALFLPSHRTSKFILKTDNQTKLMLIEAGDSATSSCLLFGHKIFPRRQEIPPINKLDAYFRTSQGILLDYYQLARNNYKRARIVKNRHQMVIKVLLERLNLSADACGSRRFSVSASGRHVDFGVSSYTQQRDKRHVAELVHSWEQFKIKFATLKQTLYVGHIKTLIDPIGWMILVASLILGVTLGILLLIQIHVSYIFRSKNRSHMSPIALTGITIFFVRTLIDQPLDPVAALGSRVRGIRYLYIAWLSYCFLVNAIYRSNLINTFTQPGHTVHIQTFKDLALDNKTIAGIGKKGRPGQSSNVREVLNAEASASHQRWGTFHQIGKKYDKEHIEPAVIDILQGRYNYLDDAIMVETAFDIMEKRYGINHYGIGRETIVV